jgi:hypothetical protein
VERVVEPRSAWERSKVTGAKAKTLEYHAMRNADPAVSRFDQ